MKLDRNIGSLEQGKLADLIVLDKNPLEDLRNSTSVRYTMVNGWLLDSGTMNEVGNAPRERAKFFFEREGGETWAPGSTVTTEQD